eukprot:3889494-Alexandrium_andersonii.AAC.1
MPVRVGRSILAGCYSSTSKARGYVYDLLHEMRCSIPARVEAYVDDMVLRNEGTARMIEADSFQK